MRHLFVPLCTVISLVLMGAFTIGLEARTTTTGLIAGTIVIILYAVLTLIVVIEVIP